MNLAIGGVDTTIVIVYLVGMVLFGMWIGRGQRDAAGYLLGGRSLAWPVVLLSIVATETSTVTFLSVPGLAYNPRGGNLTYLQLAFGLILGRLIVVWLFLPHYFQGRLFTAYDVLHRRFGGLTRPTASLLFLVTRNLGDGLRLYLAALVLKQVVDLDLSVCILLVGTVTILYTFVGGMKAVAFNDCIQFVVYIAGAITALVVIVARLPHGWSSLASFAAEQGKDRLFDFSFDPTVPYTLWAGLIGGIFLALATHGTDQLNVQRYLSCRSQAGAAKALAGSGLVVWCQFALFLLIGVGLACFYQVDSPATIPEKDSAFAQFIVEKMPVGVVGVLLAAVFSAAMSTLSSSLSASASAAVNDFYLPARRKEPSPSHVLWVSRALTIAFGVIQMGVAMAGQSTDRSVVDSVLSIAGFATGPILGLFFLAVLAKRASRHGAMAGLTGGLIVLTAVALGTKLAWTWYAILGSTATFLFGLIASKWLPDAPAAEVAAP